MASDKDFMDYVAEQIGLGSRLTYRKMFGEYALYLDGKVVAFVCDNSLFIKPSQAATALAPELPLGPPYPGAKDYPVADELLDDPDALRRLVIETASALPAPKPPRPRKKKPDTAQR
ncbi:TfoX/Sxy family protein [Stutzerimonas stutzeri]|uniref:TfoX/Sxy family protein n=1 Tax=Stutzerimonas stutzeri TaxID=316 RepID=UPI001C2ED4F5|nr:TfoX/Sxy family protein [Stutzerimonas stutzeri]